MGHWCTVVSCTLLVVALTSTAAAAAHHASLARSMQPPQHPPSPLSASNHAAVSTRYAHQLPSTPVAAAHLHDVPHIWLTLHHITHLSLRARPFHSSPSPPATLVPAPRLRTHTWQQPVNTLSARTHTATFSETIESPLSPPRSRTHTDTLLFSLLCLHLNHALSRCSLTLSLFRHVRVYMCAHLLVHRSSSELSSFLNASCVCPLDQC